jgi:hypothetical protein
VAGEFLSSNVPGASLVDESRQLICNRDGHYGLWVDSSLEKGVSASCQTFGNEPLSDEGVKFDVLGVEVWYVGA